MVKLYFKLNYVQTQTLYTMSKQGLIEFSQKALFRTQLDMINILLQLSRNHKTSAMMEEDQGGHIMRRST